MSKGLISFDLDGVLANFTRGFTRIAHDLYGTPVGDGQSQASWNFEDFPALGLTKAQCDFHNGPIWADIKSSPDFWAELDPFNTSAMHRINAIRNKVFITNRFGEDPQAQSKEFLRRWGVYGANVIVASEKGPIAQSLNVVAHVDDYYPNCVAIKEACPNALVTLHACPYNAEFQPLMNGYVTLSVDHFIDICDERGLIEWDGDFEQ